MTMLYFLLPYGNICLLIRLFYKISYIFMIRKIVRKCAFPRIRPQESIEISKQTVLTLECSGICRDIKTVVLISECSGIYKDIKIVCLHFGVWQLTGVSPHVSGFLQNNSSNFISPSVINSIFLIVALSPVRICRPPPPQK